jgi:hypothetical protein
MTISFSVRTLLHGISKLGWVGLVGWLVGLVWFGLVWFGWVGLVGRSVGLSK